MNRRMWLIAGAVIVLASCSSNPHMRQRPGQTLAAIPPLSTIAATTTTSVVVTYVVQDGDTFEMIARRLGVTADELALANGIVDRDRLTPGQVLVVPEGATTTTTTTVGNS